MSGIRTLSPYRILITRIVLLYYLFFLLWRGYCHLLPFQLEAPVLTQVNYDPVFIFFKWSGLSAFLVGNYVVSLIFTLTVITLCVLAILFPLKRGIIIVFSLLYFVLAVIFNTYLCHGSHYLAGMVLMSVTFWPRRDETFDLLWEGMRYYACWIYGSAFLWKLCMGAFFQWDAGAVTFKSNLAVYLYQNQETGFAHIYYYFLQHPFLLNIGHKLVALLEGFFLVGFFTKRYDRLLILMSLAVFLSIYLFSDVFFIELQIIIFTLIPASSWQWLREKAPVLSGERMTKR